MTDNVKDKLTQTGLMFFKLVPVPDHLDTKCTDVNVSAVAMLQPVTML